MQKIKLVKILISVFALVVVLGSGATAYYFYHKYKNVPGVEVDDLVIKISKLVELPQGEKPALATVDDREKLQGQSFFAKAQNGDKVLIYAQAQRAVLYRPSINKVIEIMNLSTGEQNNTANTKEKDEESK